MGDCLADSGQRRRQGQQRVVDALRSPFEIGWHQHRPGPRRLLTPAQAPFLGPVRGSGPDWLVLWPLLQVGQRDGGEQQPAGDGQPRHVQDTGPTEGAQSIRRRARRPSWPTMQSKTRYGSNIGFECQHSAHGDA